MYVIHGGTPRRDVQCRGDFHVNYFNRTRATSLMIISPDSVLAPIVKKKKHGCRSGFAALPFVDGLDGRSGIHIGENFSRRWQNCVKEKKYKRVESAHGGTRCCTLLHPDYQA